MSSDASFRRKQADTDTRLGRTLIDDIRRGDFKRHITRDLKELYLFYLDEDRRLRLARMNRLKRWIFVVGWLAKSLFLRLTPARRVLLLLCVVLFFWTHIRFEVRGASVGIDFRLLAFAGVLIILMLELKDKLLARDELEIGRAVQLALLPQENPVLPGWDIWMYTRPANDVGGDLVDFIPIHKGCLGLVLADVSGKGLGAALLMAKLQATLRAYATECGGLAELGARVNSIFCRDGLPNRFATLVYIEVEAQASVLRILNAGHLPPVRVSDSVFEKLQPAAMPLGIAPGTAYAEQQIDVDPGDLVVVYSDGLTEAQNEKEEFFGDERVERLISELGGLSAKKAGARLLSAVQSYVADAPQSDDLSLLILRRSL